ncbi:hypothetical protein OEV98_14280 [Caldibacillus lycopersici]|uniref:Uncharacterized protein n=1 Tax=Perspicuibacillus lycopersici TaxID=1325689 RepID=A0AAE3IUK3_9BACI|nr:hypothetical protein [Perspicuibacillus lycopersici]MCU9614707.1 hypothetical protein [Perspicuibacillus lycopersici]
MDKIAFISIMHDPNANLLYKLRDALPVIKNIYPHTYVALSNQTSTKINDLL